MGTTLRVRRPVAVIVALGLALVIAAPTVAAGPTAVHIVSPMHFNQDTFNTGTFEASGAAVDDGILCASGTVVDTGIILAGGQSGRKIQIPVRKTFTCDDGSGSFFVKIQVHLDLSTFTERFSWVIQGGTDAYASLRGSGSGTTIPDGSDPQTGNINTYDGSVID